MAPRVPTIWRTYSCDGSELQDNVAHGDKDALNTTSFQQRVERLANEYLCGKALFIQTASLRGPFDAAWAGKNPWLHKSRQNPSTPPAVRGKHTQPPISRRIRLSDRVVSDKNNQHRSRRQRAKLGEDVRRPVKRQRTEFGYSITKPEKPQAVSVSHSKAIDDHTYLIEATSTYHSANDRERVEDSFEEKRLSHGEKQQPLLEPSLKIGPILPNRITDESRAAEENVDGKPLSLPTPSDTTNTSSVSRDASPGIQNSNNKHTSNLESTKSVSNRTNVDNRPSQPSSEAKACKDAHKISNPAGKGTYMDRHNMDNSLKLAMAESGKATDMHARTRPRGLVTNDEMGVTRQTLSQLNPQTSAMISPLVEIDRPSSMPAKTSISMVERQHIKVLKRIFPKPIEELERLVSSWAFELRGGPRCVEESFFEPVSKKVLNMDDETSHSVSDDGTKFSKEAANTKGTNSTKRFMTFDTPLMPIQGATRAVRGRKLGDNDANGSKPATASQMIDTEATAENASHEATKCDASPASNRLALLDLRTNSVLSPGETVRIRRAARKSAGSWSSLRRSPGLDTGDEAKEPSPYISTQAAMERAYRDFREGFSSPERLDSQKDGQKTFRIPYSSPHGGTDAFQRQQPRIHEIRLEEDEEAHICTQDLFKAAPNFGGDSTQKQTPGFGKPYHINNDLVDATNNTQSPSRPRSSHVDPRSIMKKSTCQAESAETYDMDMKSYLEEAESFLAPFDIDAELKNGVRNAVVLSQ